MTRHAADLARAALADLPNRLTVAEVCKALHLSERHVRRLIAMGAIPVLRTRPHSGSRLIVPKESLVTFLASNS